MEKTNIVYLHGFGSGGSSEKGVLLKKYFGKSHNIITPDLSEKPEEAIKQIHSIISKTGRFIFVATSLGGFYADYFNKFGDIPCVLINPLVDPDDMIKHIGSNNSYATGKSFIFTKEDYLYLKRLKARIDEVNYTDSPEYIILAKDDEVLDYKKAFEYFINPNQLVLLERTGGHRFLNEKKIVATVSMMIEDIGDYDFNQLYNDKVFESRISALNEHYINLFSASDKSKYWPEVEAMIENSYSYIGGYKGDFKEFFGPDHLWKLVRKNGKIIAGKIYKDKFGRKAVCAFTDGTAEGKMALKLIIKEDLKLGRSWAEVSGKAEDVYRYSMKATPFPHEVVKVIMSAINKEVIDWNEDGYHYTRLINGEPHEKAIYGKIEI